MNIRRVENAHVAFWLLKDFSWCTGTHWLGLVMVVPTLTLAVRLAHHARRDMEDFAHNLATCFWIAANIVWMVGEFYFDDGTRSIAQVFFFAGLAVLGIFYAGAAARRWRGPHPREPT
jgi:hypothetical protein